MKLSEIRKGDTVNFDMITPGVFGDQYKGVIVSGIVDYQTASLVDNELNVKHENFYPQFKDTVNNINDPTIYDYLLVKPDASTNVVIAIGYPWIRPDSLQVTKGRVGEILISNWQERYRAPVTDFFNNLGAGFNLNVVDKE